MLYLTRRTGEAVIINNSIEVRVVELRGKTVKLGFTFPADASVLREEVFTQVRLENEAAMAGADALRQDAPDAPGKAKSAPAGETENTTPDAPPRADD